MPTLTATQSRQHLCTLVDDVAVSHVPVHIKGKRHVAVLVAGDDWRALQETRQTALPCA